jgi:hypothetical protein
MLSRESSRDTRKVAIGKVAIGKVVLTDPYRAVDAGE